MNRHNTCVLYIDNENIVENGNNRIQCFDFNSKFLWSAGKKGKKNDEFDGPLSVSVFKQTIYVTDYNNHRIQQFDLNGKFKSSIAISSTIWGIAVNDKFIVYSCPDDRQEIVISSHSGKIVRKWMGWKR